MAIENLIRIFVLDGDKTIFTYIEYAAEKKKRTIVCASNKKF